ncbi:EcKinase 36 [Halyomorpha halys]|nr:EcKinase 36 [Halyomorpha halys]
MDRILTSLDSLVKEGFFGDVQFVKAVSNEATDVGAQFASSLLFIDLTVKCKSEEKLLPLVIKLQNGVVGHYTHFYNELLMYKEVIPALGFDEESCPRLYYGKVDEETQHENMLIFEDLRAKKFTLCKQPLFLDFEHILIAIKKISIFHSRSYILKYKDLRKFHKLAGMFKKHDYKALYLDFDKEHIAAAERGKLAFQELRGVDVDNVLDDFLKALTNTFEVWKELLAPEEPFAVICHGDFCNNNLMFRYDMNDTPVNCALIDFQRGDYLSPGSELAFYLYMHTSAEVREKHWDKFLTIYWETLKENVPDDVEIPSFEDFLQHFARHAVYGYFIACFFVPLMMAPNDIIWDDLTQEEKLHQGRSLGGKEADEKLADIVSHMYNKRYIHAFLDSVKQKDATK